MSAPGWNVARSNDPTGLPRLSSPWPPQSGLLALWLFGSTLAVVSGTLGLPWYADDYDVMQVLGQVRAGLRGWSDLFVVPHNEHFIPLLRVLFWLGTLHGGMDLSVVRLFMVLLHAVAALGCAVLIWRLRGSRLSAWAAGTLFALSAPYVSTVFWCPTTGVFSLGAASLSLAAMILSKRGSDPWRAVSLAGLCGIVGTLGLNGTAFAFSGLGLFSLAQASRSPRSRVASSAVMTGFFAALGLGYIALVARVAGPEATAGIDLSAIPRWFFMLMTALPRLLASFFPPLGVQLGFFRGAMAAATLASIAGVVFIHRNQRPLLFSAAALWVPGAILAAAIAASRHGFDVLALYSTDRYYYFFLLPSVVTFVLLAEPLLNSVRASLARRALRASRSTGVVLLVAAAGGLIGVSRQAMHTRIPWQLMEQSKSALEKGRTLVRTVEREVKALGSSTDSQLVDVAVPLIGAHKGVLHLSSAIYAEHPSGIGGIRLTHQPLGPLDEATENRIFARWASGVGLARSPIEVAGGIATPSPVGNWIDFREVSVPDEVISGFHQPEAGLRWTKANAEVVLDPVPTELSLILWAPVDDLRRGNPSIGEIRVRVLVDRREVGCTVLRSSAPVASCFPLSATGSANRSKATVRLQVEPTWQPIRYLGMADTRDLGVAVVAIGGQPGTMPPCRHVSCDEPPARP